VTETKELKAKIEAKAEKNAKLSETVKDLRDKCSGFVTRCINRLKAIFNSVGATFEEIVPLPKISPGPLSISRMKLRPLMKL
jgi:chromosome segregation ATPase